MIYLLLIAVAPSVILLRYVYKLDKEKEPFGMLLTLFFLGVISCFPASIVEQLLEGVNKNLFTQNTYLYMFVENFFGVALVEEGFKFLFMYLYTRKHKEFNGLYDGMIYAIFVSLGFATLENIEYVFQYGFATGVTRAVLSVPGHMFFGVFMGYYYSLWHTFKLCDASETYFAQLGMINPRSPKYKYKGYLVRSIVVPVSIHGFYDFALSSENTMLILIFLAMMVLLYIICFKRIKKQSKSDMADYKLIPMILCKKYPELIGVITPRQANPMNVPQNYYRTSNTYHQNQYR